MSSTPNDLMMLVCHGMAWGGAAACGDQCEVAICMCMLLVNCVFRPYVSGSVHHTSQPDSKLVQYCSAMGELQASRIQSGDSPGRSHESDSTTGRSALQCIVGLVMGTAVVCVQCSNMLCYHHVTSSGKTPEDSSRANNKP